MTYLTANRTEVLTLGLQMYIRHQPLLVLFVLQRKRDISEWYVCVLYGHIQSHMLTLSQANHFLFFNTRRFCSCHNFDFVQTFGESFVNVTLKVKNVELVLTLKKMLISAFICLLFAAKPHEPRPKIFLFLKIKDFFFP